MSTAQMPSSAIAPGGPSSQSDARRSHKSANPIARYVRWLHTQWPAGTVEKLPKV